MTTTNSVRRWLCIPIFAILISPPPGKTQPASAHRHLLIVVDGLRPDYVTADVMPNLTALGKRGAVFNRHHAVYPTVTRVNASSISTGAYPDTHGLLGNSVFFPQVEPAKFLDTADRSNLLRIAEADGPLLTTPTIGESLQKAGRKMLVVSSGSSGSAFLNNHTLSGGAILHYQYVLPEQLSEDMNTIGPAPAADAPAALDRYAVDALLKVGIPRVDPSVTVLWLSGLDSTAHDKGIGDSATVEILRQVDGHIKRIEDSLRAAGLFAGYNIWVTSDHGFSTHTGGINLDALLKPFAGSLADGSPRIVAGGGAIYVRDGDEPAIRAIVVSAAADTRCGSDLHAGVAARIVRGPCAGHTVVRGGTVESRSFRADSVLAGLDGRGECSRDARNHGIERDGRARQLEPVGHPEHTDCGRTRPETGRHGRCPERERGLRADVPETARHRDPAVCTGTLPRRSACRRGRVER